MKKYKISDCINQSPKPRGSSHDSDRLQSSSISWLVDSINKFYHSSWRQTILSSLLSLPLPYAICCVNIAINSRISSHSLSAHDGRELNKIKKSLLSVASAIYY